MPMPKLTNCVRVQLDFVLEFEELDSLPRELWSKQPDFIQAGVRRLFPSAKARFGDIFLVLDQKTKMTRMRPKEVEKRKAAFVRWVWTELAASRAVKDALLDKIEKVGTRGQEKEQGAVTVGRRRNAGARSKPTRHQRAAKKRTR